MDASNVRVTRLRRSSQTDVLLRKSHLVALRVFGWSEFVEHPYLNARDPAALVLSMFSLGVYFVMAWRSREPNPLHTIRCYLLPLVAIAVLATDGTVTVQQS